MQIQLIAIDKSIRVDFHNFFFIHFEEISSSSYRISEKKLFIKIALRSTTLSNTQHVVVRCKYMT